MFLICLVTVNNMTVNTSSQEALRQDASSIKMQQVVHVR